MHSASIAEHLGQKKHSFIPMDKREKPAGEKRTRDPEGKTRLVLNWVKENEGKPVNAIDIAMALDIGAVSVSGYLSTLVKKNKITKERSGYQYVYRLGTGGGPRSNGSVVIAKPAAPVSSSQVDKLSMELVAFLDDYSSKVDDTQLGIFVRGTIQFHKSLKEKVTSDTPAT